MEMTKMDHGVARLVRYADQYIAGLPADRRINLLLKTGMDAGAFVEVVQKYRREQMAEIATAVEEIKARRPDKTVGKKRRLLQLRYRAELEKLAEAGITPIEISKFLWEKHRFKVSAGLIKVVLNDCTKNDEPQQHQAEGS